MPAKKRPVVLSVEARSALEKAARSNKRSALERQRARLLLASAAGRGDAEVAQGAGVHPNPVSQVRERFAAAGTRRVERAGQTRRQARLPDGAAAAHLAAPGCAGPPEGRKTWTMTLLAGRLVAARVVDSVTGETGRQTLKRNELEPWLKQGWCIPPKANAEFVAALEDVREVYHRPDAPTRPPVCLNEASKPLLAEGRAPLPIKPGEPERVDGEYTRHGTASLFMVCAPLAGRRRVFGRARRKRPDFAAVVKTLCAELDPAAEQIVRVLDQLHPHRVASLCAAFPPPAARRLAARLEIHHTPKHGSWLNLAEVELSVLARQCLAERRDPQGDLANAVAAWEHARHTAATRLDWRFATADARLKLKHPYPQTLPC